MERELIGDDASTDAMQFVAVLTDDDELWKKQTDFITEIAEAGSTYDMNDAKMESLQAIIETWCKGVWLIHKRMMWCHSPIYTLPSAESMVARDLMPVFVDRHAWPDETRRNQRGALVGLPNFGLIQVLTLLNSAPVVPDVKVQWCRNEGGACLRPSPFALKGKISGEAVSNKSISPVQSEADVEAFGVRSAKEDGARRQQAAFEKNNLLLASATRHIVRPIDGSIRFRGDAQTYSRTVKAFNTMVSNRQVSSDEVDGENLFVEASGVRL